MLFVLYIVFFVVFESGQLLGFYVGLFFYVSFESFWRGRRRGRRRKDIMSIHQVRLGCTREPSPWLAEQQRAYHHIPARQAPERSEGIS